MVEAMTHHPVFDELSGNWLCLDFTHTLDNRYGERPVELLQGYGDLVAWGQYAHVVSDDEARQLFQLAELHPAEATVAVRRAGSLREVMYRMLLEIAEGASPTEDDMEAFNVALVETMSHACIVPGEHGFTWDWAHKEQALDLIVWQVVKSAADLLTSDELDDVRACAAEDCRWLFLDTSKNRSRRWCDMKTCGNRTKARRHYERKKQA